MDKLINEIKCKLNDFSISDVLCKPLNYSNPKHKNRYGYIVMSENRACRYYYCERIKDEKERTANKLTIIMFNPSVADEYKPDRTITNTYKIVKEYTNYKCFEIFNIFNIRDKNPVCTKEASVNQNIELLRELLNIEKNEYILLAWGNLLNNEFKKLKIKQDLKQKLYNIFVNNRLHLYACSINSNNPTHLCPMNNKYFYKTLNNVSIKRENGLPQIDIDEFLNVSFSKR